MTRSKKIFAAFALIFCLLMAYFAYDVSKRTTFPGTRHATEQPAPAAIDSLQRDSLP